MPKTLLLVAAVALALAAPSAQCIEPDHLNLQEPALPLYLERKPGESFNLPPIAPEGSAGLDNAPTAQVLDAVRFVGNSAISTEDLQAVVAPFLGKAVGAADIETLRQKVSLLYVERGYINSGAILVADALDQGTLTLHLIEGRLKEICLRGLAEQTLPQYKIIDQPCLSQEHSHGKQGFSFDDSEFLERVIVRA